MKKKILHEFWGINATSVVENTAGKKPRNVLDLSSINVSTKVDTVLEKYKSYSSILSIRYFSWHNESSLSNTNWQNWHRKTRFAQITCANFVSNICLYVFQINEKY